jgi:eukaryotic-like serine/threonine-protein kinase
VLTQFGHYLLDEEIARGGMARVYRARLRGLGGFEKTLVVKQVLPELARDPRFVRMFVEEAKTLVQMSHPHVVAVYELGVVDGVYFLAMEHVDGVTLSALLRDGPLPPALAAHVGAQVCEALDYAHQRFGLVHRDVTPRNIMIEPTGHVRLLDFGIAAPAEGVPGGEVFGSPGYMSPEQALGHTLDARTDLFSLGIVLHECLTGERAFGGDPKGARCALLEGRVPRIEGREGVPADVACLVDELLAPERERRPASAAAVGRRMRSWLAGHRPEGVAPDLGERVDGARRRRITAPPEDASQASPPSGGDGEVRTLATHAALSAWLEDGTEGDDDAGPGTVPIPGRHEAPDGSAASAEPRRGDRSPTRPSPSARPTPGRGSLAVMAGAFAVLVATTAAPHLVAERGPMDDASATPPAPADPVVEHVPPPPSHPAEPPSDEAPTAPDDGPPGPTPAALGPEGTGPPQAPPPATPERTRLSVNAIPWAELRLNGQLLGTTPQRALRVPAGEHRIDLTCPPLGRSAQVRIHAEGPPLQVLADLTTDPPTITVE